ncbi:MAG: antibiotic biosynthesis monooxygenase [Gammaproteobacteria bacterium]
MIARHWRGLAHPQSADAYIEHLRAETFPGLSRIGGFLGASLLRRSEARGVEFLVITHWESLDAISQFSGDDPALAVVPEYVRTLMIEYDDRAKHYEVICAP